MAWSITSATTQHYNNNNNSINLSIKLYVWVRRITRILNSVEQTHLFYIATTVVLVVNTMVNYRTKPCIALLNTIGYWNRNKYFIVCLDQNNAILKEKVTQKYSLSIENILNKFFVLRKLRSNLYRKKYLDFIEILFCSIKSFIKITFLYFCCKCNVRIYN
jgi:hypothetical protein